MRDTNILPINGEGELGATPHTWPSAELLHGFEAAGLASYAQFDRARCSAVSRVVIARISLAFVRAAAS